MAEPERRQLHAWLSPEAYDGWRLFARSHSVNITALIEAVGRQLSTAEQPAHRLPPFLRDAVNEALRVAGSRSSRASTDG